MHSGVDALLAIAAAAAPDDPERGRRLASEAMRLVAAGAVEPYQMVAVVQGLAAISPKRAEQIAAAMTDPRYRDEALAGVAEVIAASDADRAEHVVSMISDAQMKDSALTEVAKKVIAFAPERAEHVAGMISDPYTQGRALAAIAIRSPPVTPAGPRP